MMRYLLTMAVLIAGIMPAVVASVATAEQSRTDRYGDALPKGAIARLGTLRMRDCHGPILFSPDGKYVVTVGGSNGTYYDSQALFWDIGTGRRVKMLTAKRFINRDARTGNKVEVPAGQSSWKDADGHWREWGTKAKARFQKLKLLDAAGRLALAGRDEEISHVCESPDSRYLAVLGLTGGREGNFAGLNPYTSKSFLRLWDTSTRRLVTEWDAYNSSLEIVGFSSDGRTLLSKTRASIYLWECATGRERLRLVGHKGGDVRFVFRSDGRVLVSGSMDTQVLLWDMTGRAPDGVARPAHHLPEQMRELWKALAGDDAAAAYRAIWALIDAPAQTVAWMREHLPPVAAVEPRRLSQLIADLDNDEFTVRSKATEELEHLGELAETALRKVLAGRPTLECRRRCEDLLAKLPILSGGRLRAVRAVEVLEHLSTAEARALLVKWERGAPDARLTQEARAALKRLTTAP